MSTAVALDIERLRKFTKENPKYKKVWALYSKRERPRHGLTPSRTIRLLREQNVRDIEKEDMMEFYRQAPARRCRTLGRGTSR